jgi:predicted SPOUT superfamily RNA methylase MTH1
VGQIARTAAIYKVDEIIVLHDKGKNNERDYINFFVTNLQYLETPQYLRKTLFPRSDDLANSGLMNPLDSSHHLRIDEWCPYREGCVLNRPVKGGEGSWVNIGLYKDCKIDRLLEEKTRVTVKLNEKSFGNKDLKFYTGSVVSMTEPKEKLNLYWGYTVRIAENFSELFENSIFGDKYDLILGTSDRGENIADVDFNPGFKHALIVFGGLQGIEGMLENDEKYNGKVNKIFDYYLNTCPDQGCRTIRTEEAMLISLAVVKEKLDK